MLHSSKSSRLINFSSIKRIQLNSFKYKSGKWSLRLLQNDEGHLQTLSIAYGWFITFSILKVFHFTKHNEKWITENWKTSNECL